jgi:hypothetical protein
MYFITAHSLRSLESQSTQALRADLDKFNQLIYASKFILFGAAFLGLNNLNFHLQIAPCIIS